MNSDDLEEAIAHLGLDLFSEEIRERVEELLVNGQSVEPDARVRLIGAAQRGLRQHALEREVFEVLAFETRKQSEAAVESVAQDVGIDARALRDVESGYKELQSLEPDSIAAWIETLQLDDEVALRALKSSLRSDPVEHSYASAAEDEVLEKSAQGFYDAVRKALEKRRQSL